MGDLRHSWLSGGSAGVVGAIVAVVAMPAGHVLARLAIGVAVALALFAVQQPQHPGSVPPVRGGAAAWALLSIGGVYACVPETDFVKRVAVGIVVAGVADVAGLVPGQRRTVVDGVIMALVGLSAFGGGVFRPSAVVGATAAIGLVAAPLVADRIGSVLRLPSIASPGLPSLLGEALPLGVHAAGCLAVARLAGLGNGLVLPLVQAAAVVAVACLAHAVVRPGKAPQ